MLIGKNPLLFFKFAFIFLFVIVFLQYVYRSISASKKSTVKELLNLNIVSEIDGSFHIIPANLKNVRSSQNENFTKQLEYGILKQYDLRIIAIVYNRDRSLLRLLNSLNSAIYDKDTVKLEVWIDCSKAGQVDTNTIGAARNFTFLHGEYAVYPHPTHVGIYGQWLSTWKPQENSSEIAVIFEDDLTVSPYFYKYLKLVHRKYDSYPHINGFALQGISIKHSGAAGYLEAPKDNVVFIYPVVGTWGYSPSKQNWINFLKWFSKAYHEKGFKPYVPGNIATSWYKSHEQSGRADGMWSMWYIYHAWNQNEYSLYSNFRGKRGLTVNWKESGLHYTASQSKASNPVLEEWKREYEQLPDNPVCLDIFGRVVKQ